MRAQHSTAPAASIRYRCLNRPLRSQNAAAISACGSCSETGVASRDAPGETCGSRPQRPACAARAAPGADSMPRAHQAIQVEQAEAGQGDEGGAERLQQYEQGQYHRLGRQPSCSVADAAKPATSSRRQSIHPTSLGTLPACSKNPLRIHLQPHAPAPTRTHQAQEVDDDAEYEVLHPQSTRRQPPAERDGFERHGVACAHTAAPSEVHLMSDGVQRRTRGCQSGACQGRVMMWGLPMQKQWPSVRRGAAAGT